MIRALTIASVAVLLSACYSAPDPHEPCRRGGYIDADCVAEGRHKQRYYYVPASRIPQGTPQQILPAPGPWAPIQRVAPARVPYYGTVPSQ